MLSKIYLALVLVALLPQILFATDKIVYGNDDHPVFFNVDSFEGILVRGDQDLYKDNELKCNRPRVCLEDNCRGEDVSRISLLKNYFATSFK